MDFFLLFRKKIIPSAFKYVYELTDVFSTRRHRQKTKLVQKTMSQPHFFHHVGHIWLPLVVILTSIHPPPWLSALCKPVQHSRGPPGEQTHTGGYRAVPQSPYPPPTLSASSCPTASLPICPASLPYDLAADKTRGPAVPSGWCQHFPLIQSQSHCVTDGIGDQKQQPG